MKSDLKMTVEELEEYRYMQKEAAALQAEIWALENTYHSPSFFSTGSHNSSPSNPTEQAALRIIQKEEEYQKKYNKILGRMDEIDRWLDSIKDPEIRIIVHWRYKLASSWKEVNNKVYGTYDTYDYNARKRFMRYMGVEK